MSSHPDGAMDIVPLGDPVFESDTAATADLWRLTGPDLLATAADMLPSVVGPGPVLTVDLHATLYQAACVLGVGRDRWHRLRLAEAAHDMFAAFLIAGRHVEAEPRSTDTIRRWLACQDLLMVRLALAAASGHWQRELDFPTLGVPLRSAS
jgi:hypothetical protein